MNEPLWPLVLYFWLAVLLVAALIALSHYLGERHRSGGATDEPFESGVVTVGYARLRFTAKYYLVAIFFVIFDVEALFLYAWAVSARQTGWTGFIEAVVFVAILLAALAYLWRLGALDFGPARRSRAAQPSETQSHALAAR